MKEPRRVGLKDGESVTVGQLRQRFSDELQISHDMICLVNNIQKDDNSVPPDGAVVLFKVASRKKG